MFGRGREGDLPQPSRRMKEGDTGYVRMTVLEAGADYFQIRIESSTMAITKWVPAEECALFEDIDQLKPPRRNNPVHLDR